MAKMIEVSMNCLMCRPATSPVVFFLHTNYEFSIFSPSFNSKSILQF